MITWAEECHKIGILLAGFVKLSGPHGPDESSTCYLLKPLFRSTGNYSDDLRASGVWVGRFDFLEAYHRSCH